MKKTLLFLGLASMMSAFVGCTKEDTTENGTAPVENNFTLNASIANGSANGSRVVLDSETLGLSWQANDKIKVFKGKTGFTALFEEYTTVAGDGAFSGKAAPLVEPTKGVFIALYPDGDMGDVYDYAAKKTKPCIRIVIPKNQTYTANQGPAGCIPMLGIWKEGDTKILFKPVGAAFMVPVYVATEGTKLVKAEFKPSGQGTGTGKAAIPEWGSETDEYKDPTVYYTYTDFLTGELGGTAATVTGDIAPGTTVAAAAKIYFSVGAGDYKNGFVVTFTDDAGNTMAKKKAADPNGLVVDAGMVQSLKAVQYLQKAPKFDVVVNPTDPTKVKATKQAGETLEVGYTYKYWIARESSGMESAVTSKTTIASTDYAKFSFVDLDKLTFTSTPADNSKLRFIVEATSASGDVYTRRYEYTYRKPAPVVAKIFDIQAEIAEGFLKVTIVKDDQNLWSYAAEDMSTAVNVNGGDSWYEPAFFAGSSVFADDQWYASSKRWEIKLTVLPPALAVGDFVQVACGISSDGTPAAVSNAVVIGAGTATPYQFPIKVQVDGDKVTFKLMKDTNFPTSSVDEKIFLRVDNMDWADGVYDILPPAMWELEATFNSSNTEITISKAKIIEWFGSKILTTGAHDFQLGHTLKSWKPQYVSNKVKLTLN